MMSNSHGSAPRKHQRYRHHPIWQRLPRVFNLAVNYPASVSILPPGASNAMIAWRGDRRVCP